MNQLQNVYTIGRGTRNVSIKKWEIPYFKIKIILVSSILDKTMPILMDKPKSKKGALVSKRFVLLNYISGGYIWPTIW